MRLASFRRRDEGPAAAHAALVDPETRRLWPASALVGGDADDMLTLLRRFDAVKTALEPVGPGLALADVELLAPIPVPARNIFCVGKNYRDHVKERPETGFDASGKPGGDALPEAPIIFTKAPSCVIADGVSRLPKRWSVERTFGWLNRCQRVPKTSSIASAAISPSSRSPRSASCCAG